MTPKDFKPDDGYWIFSDKKLYLLDGSMMNRTWLMVTELMRRRKDLVDDFLYPYRKKLEKAWSIDEQIVDEADSELAMNRMLSDMGLRFLEDGEDIER